MSSAVGLSIVPGLNMALEAPDVVTEGELGAKATLRFLFLTIADEVMVSGSPSLLVPPVGSLNLLIPEDFTPGDPWANKATSGEEFRIAAQAGDLGLKAVDRFGLVEAKKRVKILFADHFYITIKSQAPWLHMFVGYAGSSRGGWLVETILSTNRVPLETNKMLVLNALYPILYSLPAASIGSIFPLADLIMLQNAEARILSVFKFSGGLRSGTYYTIDQEGATVSQS